MLKNAGKGSPFSCLTVLKQTTTEESSMKITLVADVYGAGNNGTTISAARLVANLRERGHSVTVISGDNTDPNSLQLPKRKIPLLAKYIENKNGVKFSAIDENVLREGIASSDVVHFLLPFKVSKFAIDIARELHVPYTSAFHCQPENITSHIGMKDFTPLNNWFYRRFYRKFYRKVKFIHCPSQMIANELRANGYKDQDLRVISNGVIPEIRKIKTSKPAKYKDKICILFTGRYSKEKRHDLLIRATNLSKYRDKIQLFFAGTGPLKEKLERKSRTLPNRPRIEFFKFSELLDILNYADLYVHPSDIEIEAIACLEAFTCGLVPVISNSKRSATNQFALTPNNLFKAGSAKSLAAQIDYWIEHPKEKAALSKKYVEYAQQFAMNKCVDGMEQMFKDCVEYYSDYYQKLPKNYDSSKYPSDPEQHMLTLKKKPHKPIDGKYKYQRKNPFYIAGSFLLRQIAKLVLPIWAKCSTHYKIVGRENLKPLRKSGFVIISNHVNFLDAPVICAAVFPQKKVHFLTLSENMDISAGPFLRALGSIPVADTLSGMKKMKKHISYLLAKGKPVLVYPEMALWHEYRGIRPFHKGGFNFAIENDVPILPIIITFRTRKNGKQKMIVNIRPAQKANGRDIVTFTEDTQKLFIDFTNDFYKKYR